MPDHIDASTPSATRPGKLVTVLVGGLCLTMIGGLMYLWQKGVLSPDRAVALTPGRPMQAYHAINAALESSRTYMTEGEWAKSEAILRQAAMQFPEEQEIRIALAETLVAMNRHAEAYDQYEKVLAIGPREAPLEFAAGLVANTAGNAQRALEHFFAAQTADPTNASYALNLGLIQRKTGDADGAKSSLLRAANLDPQNAFAWGVLADISLNENNVGLSLQHIARARELQPESKDWRLIEARALKRQGDPEKALMVLIPMDVTQRREPHVARLIAECYGMLGRTADAAAALEDAFRADPTSADLAYDAAIGWERAGNRDKAVEFAKHSKMLGSDAGSKLLDRLGTK